MPNGTIEGLQYSAKTALACLNDANDKLDGSGVVAELLIGNGDYGTLIKTIYIKAQNDTTDGMLRFYVKTGDEINLLFEANVDYVNRTAQECSYYCIVPLNYFLEKDTRLFASTENADQNFNIIVEALDYTYGETLRLDSAYYFARTGSGRVSVANPNLDGSGELVTVFTAGTSGVNGSEITSIRIKALQVVTSGMIRFFIKDTTEESTPVLFTEIKVDATVQNSFSQSFVCEVISQGSIALMPGYSIWAST